MRRVRRSTLVGCADRMGLGGAQRALRTALAERVYCSAEPLHVAVGRGVGQHAGIGAWIRSGILAGVQACDVGVGER